MNVLIIGVILLLVVFIVYRKLSYIKKDEEELEDIDGFSKNEKLLDRVLTLVKRKQFIKGKIKEIENSESE